MKCAHFWWRQVRSSKKCHLSCLWRWEKAQSWGIERLHMKAVCHEGVHWGKAASFRQREGSLLSHWSSKTSLSQNYWVNTIVMWRRARTTLTFGYFNRYRSLTTYRNALLIRFEYCHVELVYFHCQKTTQYPSVDKLIYLFLSSFTLKNQVNKQIEPKTTFHNPTEDDAPKHSQKHSP